MQVQVDIGFEQLVNIAKKLPKTQWQKLKSAVDNGVPVSHSDDLETFLLNGPTFSEDQLKVIEDNRKAINKWRTK